MRRANGSTAPTGLRLGAAGEHRGARSCALAATALEQVERGSRLALPADRASAHRLEADAAAHAATTTTPSPGSVRRRTSCRADMAAPAHPDEHRRADRRPRGAGGRLDAERVDAEDATRASPTVPVTAAAEHVPSGRARRRSRPCSSRARRAHAPVTRTTPSCCASTAGTGSACCVKVANLQALSSTSLRGIRRSSRSTPRRTAPCST